MNKKSVMILGLALVVFGGAWFWKGSEIPSFFGQKEMIMANIEMYSTDVCPYCVRAKTLLESKGVEYAEYNISKDADKMAEMLKRSGGRRTVPQIFVAGQHVGGSDDLAALDAEGKLDKLLESLPKSN